MTSTCRSALIGTYGSI